jgi:hypothetical protein
MTKTRKKNKKNKIKYGPGTLKNETLDIILTLILKDEEKFYM